MKTLRRSSTNRTVAGVIGGLGEYFDVDPTVLRVLFVFTVLVTGIVPGVIAYLLAILIMPAADTPTIHEVREEEKGSDAS